jgi:hypothetical protein
MNPLTLGEAAKLLIQIAMAILALTGRTDDEIDAMLFEARKHIKDRPADKLNKI